MSKDKFRENLAKILKIDEDDEDLTVEYDSLQSLEIAVCYDKYIGVQPEMNEIINCKSLKMFMNLADNL